MLTNLIRFLILVLSGLLSTFVFGEQIMGTRLVCPCTLESNGALSAKVSMGVVNDSDTDSGILQASILLSAGASRPTDGFYSISKQEFGSVKGGSSSQMVLEIPFDLPDYGLDDEKNANFWIDLKERDSTTGDEDSSLKRVGMQRLSPVKVTTDISKKAYTDGELYFIGDPVLTTTGDQGTVTIPKLVNNTEDDIQVDMMYMGYTEKLELWGEPYLYQFGLNDGEETLTVPGSSFVENVKLEGTFTEPPEDRPFGFVFVRSGETNTQMYQYIDARPGNNLPQTDFTARTTDYLQDSDADGVSDFQERITGTNPTDPNSAPQTAIMDVLVLYTEGFSDFYNGEPAAKWVQDIEWSNQALANSEINAMYRLVGSEPVALEDGLRIDEILEKFFDKTGEFENFDAKRTRYGADFVSLYIRNAEPSEDGGVTCGSAPMPTGHMAGDYVGVVTKENLIAAVGAPCSSNAMTHELGHNLGLVHSKAQGDRDGSFFWSRGHGESGKFSTLMSYPQAYTPRAQTVQYYSNPEVQCNGNPCGAPITDIDNGANAALSVKTVIYQAASLYGTLGIDADSNGIPDDEETLSTDTNSSSDESESEQQPLSGTNDQSGNSSDSGIEGQTFNGKEYRWIKERKTQEAAQAHAESLGGHLVVINSAAEDDFVYSMVNDASLSGLGTASDGGGVSYVWLGGNDAGSEGNWVWVNGEAFSYTNWGRAEPDNYFNQDGLAMGLENWPEGRSGSSAFGLAGEWNDIDRSNELTFIVELPIEGAEGGDGNGSEGDQSSNDSSGSEGDSSSGTSSDATADFESPYSVSIGPFGGCAIDDNGLNCWGTGWISDPSQIPVLSNPTKVTVGRAHACALDDSGVSCWGYNEEGQTDIPALNNPYVIVARIDTTCALDDDGLKCWGDNSDAQSDVPALVNPREVALGFHNTCALDDTGIVCWGDTSRDVFKDIPMTVNPSNLTMGELHGCVLDNGIPICWARGFNTKNTVGSNEYNQPQLTNVRNLVAGGYHACAIDDQNLKCWGESARGQLNTPAVSNPSKLFKAGRFGLCVLDDNGLQCWGTDEESVNEDLPTDLSFTSASKRVVTQYLQTTSASQNISTLDVINTSDRSQTFRGILRGGSGEKVGLDQPVLGSNVPSMGRLSLTSSDLESIFEIAPWSGPAMLTIQGDSTFDLMSKLESPSGLVSNTNCVRDNRVLNLEGFDSDNLSYVRLINTGAKTTGAITGTLYAADGSVVGTANARLVPKLNPYQQTWVSRDRLSSLIGAEWNGEGMLEVNPVPGLKLLNLNFVTDESTFFNFSCADKATLLAEPSSSSDPANIARMYLQTTSTSANVSLTHLVNTSDSPQRYIGTLYGSDGVQVGSADQPLHSGTVPAKGRLIISSTDIESAFNISPWSGPAILEVKGDGLFELMTKLESPSGLISNTNCVRTEQVHNVGGFDQTDVSYVRFINIGDTDLTNIRGTLFDDNGNAVGSADQVLVDSLPAKSHVWRNRSQLSTAIGARWNGTASLRITSAPEDLRLLNLNYINSETFFNFSCYQSGR